MNKVAEKQAPKENAIEHLKKHLQPGSRVYTVLSHVSSSGMSRVIRVLVPYLDVDGKPQIRDVSYFAAKALDWKINEKYNGVTVGVCGMDVGFHLIHTLSRTLFSYEDTKDSGDPGYLLNQTWL